ncbi:MAG: pyridine nucleotide-disulfide oxidoreductase [Bacillota bacterium]|nr:MAG: pyridine nucleotide-disulfide oxidoreductase [Bacillota bacterium]
MKRDIVIIGGGPAGLAAAIAAYDAGCKDVLVVERENRVGGVLKQCIHNGFGLTRFKENLTGPEYAHKFIDEAEKRGIEMMQDTFVTALGADKTVTCMNERGIFTVQAKAVILAMGCRERSKGALNIAGTRPAGLFSAGTAQKYVNIKGMMVGKRVVILGSGDIGLIMARRLTLEGAKVLCVSEIMPYSSGLRRNIAQCLDDFGIPLYLEHTVVEIEGKERVSGVTIAKVDERKRPIAGTEKHFDCDTVLFSVGLIPENELTKRAGIVLDARTKGAAVDGDRQTDTEGVFACGNVLHVHDLVDFVSEEAEIAGRAAAEYVLSGERKKDYIFTECGENISYVLPQRVDKNKNAPQKLFFRVRAAFRNAEIAVDTGAAVKKIKKLAVAPGEMESVTLSAGEIAAAKYVKISVTGGER